MALRAVPGHPKFAQLKEQLGLGKCPTLGYLEGLWHFAGSYTPQGNLGKFTDKEIERWLEWDGAPGALIAAFIRTRWVDRDPVHRLVVHDWHAHCDQSTKKLLGRQKRLFVQDMSWTCPAPSPDMDGQAGAGAEEKERIQPVVANATPGTEVLVPSPPAGVLQLVAATAAPGPPRPPVVDVSAREEGRGGGGRQTQSSEEKEPGPDPEALRAAKTLVHILATEHRKIGRVGSVEAAESLVAGILADAFDVETKCAELRASHEAFMPYWSASAGRGGYVTFLPGWFESGEYRHPPAPRPKPPATADEEEQARRARKRELLAACLPPPAKAVSRAG